MYLEEIFSVFVRLVLIFKEGKIRFFLDIKRGYQFDSCKDTMNWQQIL